MQIIAQGQVQKLRGRLDQPVQYWLPLGDERVALNPLLRQRVALRHTGRINCVHCQRSTKRSCSQGYCWPCFQRLAQCDACIIAPEKCHYPAGTCREPVWADEFCMQDHIVYLANSSGLKVGITRASQLPTRWIDQGAVQALPVLRVRTRQQSGFAEAMFRQHIADRTNWRGMLRGDGESIDLGAQRDRLIEDCGEQLEDLRQQFGEHAISVLNGVQELRIAYPLQRAPETLEAFNLDKEPLVEGTLLGIKGQYLVLDRGVINIRKYTGYELEFSAERLPIGTATEAAAT